jgi:hypothetical protein
VPPVWKRSARAHPQLSEAPAGVGVSGSHGACLGAADTLVPFRGSILIPAGFEWDAPPPARPTIRNIA